MRSPKLNSCSRIFLISLLCICCFGIKKSLAFDNTSTKTKVDTTDVRVLNEENSIEISGQKASFISFTINKKIKFKVLTEKGLHYFSEFVLPETFDPTYISHFPKKRNHTHVYSNFKVESFKVFVSRAGGEPEKVKAKRSFEHVRMVMVEDNTYGNFDKVKYRIGSVEVGDEVSVEYQYVLKYSENSLQLSSLRVFFHSEYLKENYQFYLSHHSDLNINILYNNGATPDSTGTVEGRKFYLWKKQNSRWN